MEAKLQSKQQVVTVGRSAVGSTPDKTTTAGAGELDFRQLTAPVLNVPLQEHNAINFRLIKTVADFTQQLSSIHEQHAEELQMLVETFRKKNAELRRERQPFYSTLFTSWEVLLQEVEVDSQVHGDIARSLGRQVGTFLLEKTFHRKIQSRKIFHHRESYETILSKAEEMLNKCHQDYCDAFAKLLSTRNHTKLAEYYDMHNAYVQQLHAANGMLDYYHRMTLPKLLEELEDIYTDISNTISGAIWLAADVIANKSREQARHYDNIAAAAQAVNAKGDVSTFIKSFNPDKLPQPITKHIYNPPYMENDPTHIESGMLLRNELVIDRLSDMQLPTKSQALKQDVNNLEAQIKRLQEAIESMERLQHRSFESSLYNKANELQEEISLKKFDLQVAHIHMAAVQAQLKIFLSSNQSSHSSESNHIRDRKVSVASTGNMKNKWLKAFRSLTTGSSGNLSEKGESASDKKNPKSVSRPLSATPANSDLSHAFQEYTYKKITACDQCKEILRGHSKQGLKCRMCKMNVHADCRDKAGYCEPKPRILRRQKSSSELEARTETAASLPEAEKEESAQNVDPIYQLLKQAGDLSSVPKRSEKNYGLPPSVREHGNNDNSSNSLICIPQQQRWSRSNASSSASSSSASSHLLNVSNHPDHTSASAPHSPQRKRQSLRMKSFSLDSSDSTKDNHGRHDVLPPTSQGSSHSKLPRDFLQTSERQSTLVSRNARMSSVDLPDENENSLSSESTSPTPSLKQHRILPTNLYVVLYNFRSRHPDEIDLKAGHTITVTDTVDPDWWQGKCLGKIGYFPSQYVAKLYPGERPLQVAHTVHVSDGESTMKLLNEQIVIQIGEEQEGIVNIRTGANDKTYSCPSKYLNDV